MTKFLLALIVSLAIISCGSSDNGTPQQILDEINVAPSVPELLYPTDELLCIDNLIPFSWKRSIDPNGDLITYQFELSEDNQFSQIGISIPLENEIEIAATLEKGKAHYWHVKAIDANGAESAFSPTFSFYTEGDVLSNHLPFAPQLIKPLINGTVEEDTVKLQWSAGDTDGDPLTYDVYFGTNNPPTVLLAENLETTFFETNVVSATEYYWSIIVKDDKGGQSEGHIWSFSTN
ncbi:MAG: hypothetical protein AB8B59_02485 [Maribacter sp.]